jgi:hypothetical protein
MSNQKITSKLSTAFKLDEMSESERDSFLNRAGNIIIDASLIRLLGELDEAEVQQLQAFLAGHGGEHDPFSYLFETYSQFETIMEEEIVAFQTEAESVVG